MHTNEQSKCEAFDMNQKVKSKREIKIEFYMKKKNTLSLFFCFVSKILYIFSLEQESSLCRVILIIIIELFPFFGFVQSKRRGEERNTFD